MRLIDSHAHLDFSDFSHDLEAVITKAKDAGVDKIINVGAGIEHSKNAITVANKYNNIWATVGVHPEDSDLDIKYIDESLRSLAESPRVVAIGECGLDYYVDERNKDQQRTLFTLHINLAKELGLPLVVHIRNGADNQAVSDAYEILKKDPRIGVIHCFTLDSKWADKFMRLGFFLGITGIVTFKNAKTVQDSAFGIPLERLLIETDCPYLAPQKYRGKRNEPAYVIEVANKVAEIKNVSLQVVAEKTTENAEKLFKLVS